MPYPDDYRSAGAPDSAPQPLSEKHQLASATRSEIKNIEAARLALLNALAKAGIAGDAASYTLRELDELTTEWFEANGDY